MESSNQERLRAAVVERSRADEWFAAKREWALLSIFDRPTHCVCGQAIVENCVIRNAHTGAELVVGNVCINQFDEAPLRVSARARASLTKLAAAPETRRASRELLDVALRLRILSAAEHARYVREAHGTGSRTRYDAAHADFAPEQLAFRTKANRLVLLGFCEARPRCACDAFAKPRQNARTGAFFYSCAAWPHGCAFTRSAPHRNA